MLKESEISSEKSSEFGKASEPGAIKLVARQASNNFSLLTAPDNYNKKSPEAKKKWRRKKAIEELLLTEVTFVQSLDYILNAFCLPLSRFTIITKEEHAVLFPAILKAIHNLNKKLLTDLRAFWADFDNETSELSQLLREYGPFLKMFCFYCTAYDQTRALLGKLVATNSEFVKFCEFQRQRCKCEPLASLLVCPIQRPSRYNLLIREIASNTLWHHIDLVDLQACHKLFTDVNNTINQSIKDADARDVVRQIESDFGGIVSLVNPSRVYLRKGEFYKVCRSDNRLYIFWLFNDLLLYGVQSVGVYKLHKQMNIDNSFRVYDLPDTKSFTNTFEIRSRTKSFLAYTKTLEEKRAWLDMFQRCINQVKENYEARGLIFPTNPRYAPIWMPDHFSDSCCICTTNFSLFRRRHHCRICGRLVCSSCRTKYSKDLNGKKVPACDLCCGQHGEEQNEIETKNNVNNIPDYDQNPTRKIVFKISMPGLPNVDIRTTKLMMARDDEGCCANGIIDKVLKKCKYKGKLDFDMFVLQIENLGGGNVFIAGDKPLAEYKLFRNFTERELRFTLCSRAKASWLHEAQDYRDSVVLDENTTSVMESNFTENLSVLPKPAYDFGRVSDEDYGESESESENVVDLLDMKHIENKMSYCQAAADNPLVEALEDQSWAKFSPTEQEKEWQEFWFGPEAAKNVSKNNKKQRKETMDDLATASLRKENLRSQSLKSLPKNQTVLQKQNSTANLRNLHLDNVMMTDELRRYSWVRGGQKPKPAFWQQN